MPDDPRDVLRRRPLPTKVRELIHGQRPRAATEPGAGAASSSGVIAAPGDPASDRSTPIEMDGEAGWRQRVEWRLQSLGEADVELAKGVGNVLSGVDALVALAEKSDRREERREDRAAELAKTRGSNRTQVLLALLAALSTIGAAWAIGTRSSAGPGPQIQMTAPAMPIAPAAPVLR